MMLKRFAIFSALFLASPALAQEVEPAPDPALEVAPEAGPETSPVAEPTYALTHVVLETTMGDILVVLETERAPITAANFLRYVEEDRFDGTVFYRAMRLDWGEQPNGLIQGGAQNDWDRILEPIAHEPTNETGVLHEAGSLSMAMGEPGTANGDFSILLRAFPQMDADAGPDSEDPARRPGYAAFGHVVEGMDVVLAIHAAPIDPEKGQGWMTGQMLAEPVVIVDARIIGENP